MKSTKTALEIYLNKVYKIFIAIVPFTALSAGMVFTTLRLMGYYEGTSILGLIIFDLTLVVYTTLGLLLYRFCQDEEGNVKQKFVLIAKILIILIEIIQWNFITYLFPVREFWAYILFFSSLTIFLIDEKLVLIVESSLFISMIISWFILPDVLLPIKDAYFIPNLVLRCISVLFGLFVIWIFVYLVKRVLIKELETVASFDPLTHLHNRRELEITGLEMISEADKNSSSLSAFMADIDDFKKINDKYGHPFGDLFLKEISRTISYNIGEKGIAFRYGGEEFLVFVKLPMDKAVELAEKIRKHIEKVEIEFDGKPLSVTVTIGVANYSKGLGLDKLIKIADTNLYYGKTHGKNKVIN